LEIKGFRNLEKTLNKMQKNLEEYESGKEIGFSELFNPSFMKKYTKFSTIEEFFEKSPFKVENQEDFKNLDEKEFNKYISETTQFTSWEEMKGKAGEIHILKKMGL